MTFKKILKNFLFCVPGSTTAWWIKVITGVFGILYLGMLLIRREMGCFTGNMPVFGAFLFAFVNGGMMVLLWSTIVMGTQNLTGRALVVRRIFAGVFLFSFLIGGLAILPPGTSVLSQLVFALSFLVVFVLVTGLELADILSHSWRECVPSRGVESGAMSESEEETEEEAEEEFEEEFEEETEEEFEEEPEELLPPEVLQQLTRSTLQDGCERVSGLLRGNFGANQNRITLFVSFCPPFTSTPKITCYTLEGEAEIEPIHIAPQGVSLLVKKRQRVPFEDSVILNIEAEEAQKPEMPTVIQSVMPAVMPTVMPNEMPNVKGDKKIAETREDSLY